MFEIKRLILRPISIQDSEEVFNYRSRENDNLYQSFVPKEKNEVIDFIKKCSIEFNKPDTWFQLVIIEKISKKIIGDIGVNFIDELQVEFGITLMSEYQNFGFAFEALNELFYHLFYKFNKYRITASVDPRNINSIKLLEKLKMRKESHHIKSYLFKDEWVDDCIYAILSSEYTTKKKNSIRSSSFFYYFFNKSLISVNSNSSFVGSGGAASSIVSSFLAILSFRLL